MTCENCKELQSQLAEADKKIDWWIHQTERNQADYLKVNAQLAEAKERIAELEEELEDERAKGIHSCSPFCKRPLCVAQRQIAEYDRAMQDIAEGLWWDGNEPWRITRLESWAKYTLTRIRQMGEK